jgi:hypothetical protein
MPSSSNRSYKNGLSPYRSGMSPTRGATMAHDAAMPSSRGAGYRWCARRRNGRSSTSVSRVQLRPRHRWRRLAQRRLYPSTRSPTGEEFLVTAVELASPDT